MKKLTVVLAFVLLLVLVLPVQAETTNPVVYDGWKSGDADFECAQVGKYMYAYKVNAAAPNGSWMWEGNTITIYGSDGKVFSWSATSGIGAVIVKAATGANVWFYDPQVKGDTGLYGYDNKDVSHVTFCWNPEPEDPEEWCSPGYWRQTQHLDSWAATGYEPEDDFAESVGYTPPLSKKGKADGAESNPTLWQVLQAPQYYGGDAFNAVGDLLSGAHPDVNFLGTRVSDSCPLN
jgi:hypothetical protein